MSDHGWEVHPIELWDLLSLLGLPPQWSAAAFLDYFDLVTRPNPSNEELDRLAALFRSFEAVWGELEPAEVMQRVEGLTRIRAKKILGALRDQTSIPRHQLETHERASALRLLKTTTPVSQLFSRHGAWLTALPSPRDPHQPLTRRLSAWPCAQSTGIPGPGSANLPCCERKAHHGATEFTEEHREWVSSVIAPCSPCSPC